MKRHAFAMRLKPGMADEYRRRHDAIWPELVREHRDCGIHDYSIFFDAATDTLFAFCKLDDDGSFAGMPEDDVVKRWWKYNADLMYCHDDNRPVGRDLVEVFHMD